METYADTLSSVYTGRSEAILNSLRDQVCLIDGSGTICFVNEEWNRFAVSNGGALSSCSIGVNYLQQCKNEPDVYKGLKSVLAGETDCFNFEYPCHSPDINRWFLMQATPLQANKRTIEGAVIRHVDITKQKLLELQLQEYAEKDPLTSLFNRRYFEERLPKEAKRSLQNRTSLSLLYIDTDNFKEINDSYGHPAGDYVLKELANRMATVIRPSDTVARIGGDEFVIVLPDTGHAELKMISHRLIQEIQQLDFQYQHNRFKVTVSIGGKSFNQKFSTDSMMEWVDQAVYLAKEKGKNKAVIFKV